MSDTESLQQQRRPRGAQKKKNNKAKAEALINERAAPISLSDAFTGYVPTSSSGVDVVLDRDIPERFCSYAITLLKMTKDMQYRFSAQQTPYTDMAHGLSAILCSAMALKLVQASPKSDTADIRHLDFLSHQYIRVPKTYMEVLNLVGKTDVKPGPKGAESKGLRLRVMDNIYMVRYYFAKAIWHQVHLEEFRHSDRYFSGYEDMYDRLQQLSMPQLANIVFDDPASMRHIRKEGGRLLDTGLHTEVQFEIVVAGVPQPLVCCPPFLSDPRNRDELVDWLGKIAIYPADVRAPLALSALVAAFENGWLSRVDTPFNRIDERFQGLWMENDTPGDVLRHAGLYSGLDLFDGDQGFADMAGAAVSFCDELASVFDYYIEFVDMARSEFGNVASLATVDPSQTRPFQIILDRGQSTDNFLNGVKVIKRNESRIESKLMVGTPGNIITAASMMITRWSNLHENYRGNTTMDLSDHAKQRVMRSVIRHSRSAASLDNDL